MHMGSVQRHCIACHCNCRLSLEEAAAHVARLVAGWSGIGAQKVTATTVQNWRTEERAEPSGANTAFQLMVMDLRSRSNPRAEIERLLRDGPPEMPKF
jgi:hypothetical protein